MRFLFLASIGFIILVSCSTNKDISGVYYSNFAVNGFFVTRLKLNSDSTLEYRYWGDMAFDTAVGTFRLDGKQIIPHYLPIAMDTTGWGQLRKDGFGYVIDLELSEHIRLKSGISAPKLMHYKKERIYLFDSTGLKLKYKSDRNGRKRIFYLRKDKS